VSGAGLLELRGIAKSYGAPDGSPLEVLKGVDLEVGEGESVAVTGPSGSGKSTLLNIVGTLDRPDAGALLFRGRDLCTLQGDDLYHFRNREIGFVFQSHHLLPHLTVLENVLVPTLASAGPDAGRRARGLLERVGLGGRLDHRPAALSGGERQRTAVVRALINGPGLLLADEPTGSLDREGTEQLADLLVELNAREGTALVMVTHSSTMAARADRSLELRDGVLRRR